MKPKKQVAFKYIIFAVLFLIGTLVVMGDNLIDSNTPFQIPTASANAHLGILGQPAPELNLSIWIDGNGKKTGSIGLSDYRGKVVYLYFFQDW